MQLRIKEIDVEETLAKKRQATSTGGAKPQLVAVPPHAVERMEQGKRFVLLGMIVNAAIMSIHVVILPIMGL